MFQPCSNGPCYATSSQLSEAFEPSFLVMSDAAHARLRRHSRHYYVPRSGSWWHSRVVASRCETHGGMRQLRSATPKSRLINYCNTMKRVAEDIVR